MIKFFRQLRQRYISEGKTTKYFKYAIGEIILVVIGILIALQINNWNENQINKKKEIVILTNFQQDLRSDFQKLDSLKLILEEAAKSKKLFERVFEEDNDSIILMAIHFKNQYSTTKDFTPNTITISELKNTAGISVISNSELRRQLVSLYNTYEYLAIKLNLGTEKLVQMVNYTSSHFNNVLSPTDIEVQLMIKDPYFRNQMRANYVLTQLDAVKLAHNNCKITLTLIDQELND